MPGPYANLIAFIPDPDAEPESWFGQPKASGDTLVAGAHGDDHSGLTNAGTAYVFVRSGDNWVLEQELTAFDAASGDGFGYQVEVFGNTVAVGAPGVDHSGIQDAGAVYVYTRSGNTWTLQQTADCRQSVPVGFWANDRVRWGHPRCRHMGELGLTSSLARADTWSEQYEFSAPDPDSGGLYGMSVAIDSDTILVGDGFAYDRGSVYVYEFRWHVMGRMNRS